MAKETDSSSESQVQEAEPEIIATGDAVLVSRAIDNLASAIRQFAETIGELKQVDGDDEENPADLYLDGTKRRK